MTEAIVERYFDGACFVPALRAIGQSRQLYAREGLLPHREPCFEIHLVMDGSVHWWVEDETYQLQPDTIYVTKPGELHGAVQSVVQPCTLNWLQVDTAFLADESIRQGMGRLERRITTGAGQLVEYVLAMLQECRQPRPDSKRIVSAYLQLFLAKMLRQFDGHDVGRAVPDQFDLLLTYIEALLPGNITIEMLCARANLSRSRIFQLFHQYVGQSPVSYIMSMRIQRAEHQLRYSTLPITDIAFNLGFSSSQHFATVFKRHTGQTPSQFRKGS